GPHFRLFIADAGTRRTGKPLGQIGQPVAGDWHPDLIRFWDLHRPLPALEQLGCYCPAPWPDDRYFLRVYQSGNTLAGHGRRYLAVRYVVIRLCYTAGDPSVGKVYRLFLKIPALVENGNLRFQTG